MCRRNRGASHGHSESYMLTAMHFRVWIGCCLALLLLLWLIPNTRLLPVLASFVTTPPPPPKPNAPGIPFYIYEDEDSGLNHGFPSSWFLGNITNSYESGDIALLNDQSHTPCSAVDSLQNPSSVSGTSEVSLARTLVTGQQNLERLKQESEAAEKRFRLYVQAGLTLLLAAVCLFILVQKKTTPTQRAAATGVLGIALGYWFK